MPSWGWRDPQASVILPFWRSAVPELRVVLPVRHPLEVVASMTAGGTSSPALALRLWRVDLTIPLTYGWDSSYYGMVVQATVESRRRLSPQSGFSLAREQKRTLSIVLSWCSGGLPAPDRS